MKAHRVLLQTGSSYKAGTNENSVEIRQGDVMDLPHGYKALANWWQESSENKS